MDQEFKYSMHVYTYTPETGEFTHMSCETNVAKKKIKELLNSGPFSTAQVFLVLNGRENEEEAYIFEDGAMMRVFSYDAIKAVELIACLPFYQYSDTSLIKQMTKVLHRKFVSLPDEKEYPF